jgi:hypothetical protein
MTGTQNDGNSYGAAAEPFSEGPPLAPLPNTNPANRAEDENTEGYPAEVAEGGTSDDAIINKDTVG